MIDVCLHTTNTTYIPPTRPTYHLNDVPTSVHLDERHQGEASNVGHSGDTQASNVGRSGDTQDIDNISVNCYVPLLSLSRSLARSLSRARALSLSLSLSLSLTHTHTHTYTHARRCQFSTRPLKLMSLPLEPQAPRTTLLPKNRLSHINGRTPPPSSRPLRSLRLRDLHWML
jgi:hypothetical protein